MEISRHLVLFEFWAVAGNLLPMLIDFYRCQLLPVSPFLGLGTEPWRMSHLSTLYVFIAVIFGLTKQ